MSIGKLKNRPAARSRSRGAPGADDRAIVRVAVARIPHRVGDPEHREDDDRSVRPATSPGENAPSATKNANSTTTASTRIQNVSESVASMRD